MQAKVLLNRQAQALCACTAPFIPVLHRASTNMDQTSFTPLLQSHKSLHFTGRSTKAQRDLRLNPMSFKQPSSFPHLEGAKTPCLEEKDQAPGPLGQPQTQGEGSLSCPKRLRPHSCTKACCGLHPRGVHTPPRGDADW